MLSVARPVGAKRSADSVSVTTGGLWKHLHKKSFGTNSSLTHARDADR